ncbi:MAG: GSCFA domain-containing protein [Bacteroidales bacterium]|nr:GSCFA domain-containing protein [Bacteroidales bacterium]
MESFRTPVTIHESADKINYQTKCLFMGSCFADSIGKIMAGYQFPVLLNPFGTLFNPASIADNLTLLISGKTFTRNDLRYHHDLWFSLNHYTAFSHPNPETCLARVNQAATEATAWLKNCHYLLLTFGTSWAYQYKETGKVVANCHKLPSSQFNQVLLQPTSIIEQYNQLLRQLKSMNPDIRVIFTLSPVRHWSNGAVGNQLSKSVLHYSIHEIVKSNNLASYFPAYEIFMDELRDYRFYAGDMLHPSEQGTRYVWERFCDTRMDKATKKIMAGVEAVLKAMNHRPLHTDTTNHKIFRQNTLKLINQLQEQYPFLDFHNEIAQLLLN